MPAAGGVRPRLHIDEASGMTTGSSRFARHFLAGCYMPRVRPVTRIPAYPTT